MVNLGLLGENWGPPARPQRRSAPGLQRSGTRQLSASDIRQTTGNGNKTSTGNTTTWYYRYFRFRFNRPIFFQRLFQVMGRIPKVPQSRTCGQRRIQMAVAGGGCRRSGNGRPPAGSRAELLVGFRGWGLGAEPPEA